MINFFSKKLLLHVFSAILISFIMIHFVSPDIVLAQGLINENLEPITVLANELVTTTATVVSRDKIINRVYVTPADILKNSPGVAIFHFGQGGAPDQIRLRGFVGGPQEGVAFFLDGVNFNDSGGIGDSSKINPIEIDNVEIIKGPSSVFYGNHASGGAVHYHTISNQNLSRINVTYGSFNTIDGSGIFSRVGELVNQTYSFQGYHTDGYRDYSDWDRYNLAARWTLHPNNSFSATLGVRNFYSDWNSAGWARNDLPLKAQAYDDGSGEGNGGTKEFRAVQLDANYEISSEQNLKFNASFTDRDNIRYFKYSADSDYAEKDLIKSWGVGVLYELNTFIGDRKLNVTGGLNYLREDAHYQIWNLGLGRTYEKQTRDVNFNVNTFSAYGEILFDVIDSITLRTGVRYDRLTGDLTPNMTFIPNSSVPYTLEKGKTYKSKGFSIVSPKFGILFSPIDQLQIYANYGRGFQSPDNSSLAFYYDPSQQISHRDQMEFGFRSKPLDWIEFGAGYYRIDTSQDMEVDVPLHAYRFIGQTVRTGVETYADLSPVEN
ncbi:MAG: TonB-dependent receptor, partial [Clostridiales Family XIII bacterium]|nr:TonB-dependent receptor [Clostridiales Family XIII bacterium]